MHNTLAATLLALGTVGAHAGRSCDGRPPSVDAVQRGMALAQRTAAALDASGAQVVVLARAGQDLSAYGLRWSHLGLAYRESASTGIGKPATWRVVHKLNQCGTAQAAIYRQGLGEFFLDDPFEYEAAIVVLAPDVQSRMLAALRDNTGVAALNTPAYSMVAYPWAQTYQQSNQWAIETLALTQDAQARSRERAQAWLKLKGYEPGTLKISAMKRLGARMTAANVAFDDHPNDKRFSDRIETVTVDSVFAWLARSGLGGPVQVVR
ncbi:MAG: membrane protein [Methylibium sp. NZG]|nr:MAG: membrane protein [Methylibium sp. NZG]